MSPIMQARMQRTTSTPAQPQVQSSWRPDLPDEPIQDNAPCASPQSFSQQPVLCTSPPVQAASSRAPVPRSTGTDPVCQPDVPVLSLTHHAFLKAVGALASNRKASHSCVLSQFMFLAFCSILSYKLMI